MVKIIDSHFLYTFTADPLQLSRSLQVRKKPGHQPSSQPDEWRQGGGADVHRCNVWQHGHGADGPNQVCVTHVI